MKTIVAISLSFLVFFQSVGFGVQDIFLLGKLAQHAEHHSENHGDDFFTFMQKHYGTLKAEHQENDAEDKHDHEELPFQHISCHHILSDIALVPFEFPLIRVVLDLQHTHTFNYQNLYSSLEKVSIFQPPKFA